MEELIERLRAATGAEIAVVTLPTIGDRSEAEVALAIGRAWGVGAKAEIGDQRRNAGIVVLLVPRQEGQPGQRHPAHRSGQRPRRASSRTPPPGAFAISSSPRSRRENYGPALLAGVQALVERHRARHGRQ